MSQTDAAQPEATITDEELELEQELEDTEDVETLKAQIEKANQFARQAVARAKKAEAEAKALKEKKPDTAEATQSTSKDVLTPEDVDMRILKLQGMSDELLIQLKKVAAVTGKSLIDAQTDPVFLGIKNQQEADKKAEQARLGTSRSSGSLKKEKVVNTPGLSDEEHKELWKKQNGL